MSQHRVFIPTVTAEHLLDLPESVHITSAWVDNGELVLGIASKEDLGATELNALYGNIEEDEETVHFGMFEDRSPNRSSSR